MVLGKGSGLQMNPQGKEKKVGDYGAKGKG